MCNMFQMTTTIVSVPNNNTDSPTIQQVGPDPDILKLELPNTVEIAAGLVPDMFLLLQGAHYDLAVSRESMNEKYSTKDGYNAEEEEDELPRDEPKTTEDKLKDLEGKYAELKLNYVTSLKEIKTLKAKLKKVDIESRNTPEESNTDNDNLEEVTNIVKLKSYGFKKTSPQNAPESQLKCPVCKFIFIKESVLAKHMDTHDKDGDWTCGECSYQTMTKKDLDDHKNKAHRPKSRPRGQNVTPVKESRNLPASPLWKSPNQSKGERSTTCTKCDKDFVVYLIDLTKHIRENHKSYKPCRNIETCAYNKRCRWNHKTYPEGNQVCYECGENFKTMHELVRHRKAVHKVSICKDFFSKNCGYSSED